MKKIQILLALLFIVLTPYLQAQPTDCISDRYQAPIFDNIRRTNDITYGVAENVSGAMQSLELDFYEPDPSVEYLGKRPLVVMFFGGAYLGGDKQWVDMVAWCDSLSRYGYACASIEYRLDNAFNLLFPDQGERAAYRAIQDGRAAIRFLLEDPNGFGFNIDRDHIYTGGNSAGAITAIHVAYADDTERPPATFSPDMGCGDCSGNNYMQTFTIAGVIDLWGAILDLSFIDVADNIPMVLIHGTNDNIVPYNSGQPFGLPVFPVVYGAVPMAAEMDSKNICNQFYPYPGEGHSFYLSGSTSMNSFWPPIFNQGRTFLYDKTLQFDSPIPTGALTACVGNTEIYSVPANADSYFCWDIIGGTVISANNGQVTVQWDVAGTGQLTLTEANCLDVIGTAQTINVDVSACSCASLDLGIQFDGFPGQSSWEIVDDSNNSIVSSGGTYTSTPGNSTLIESTCLPDGCYTLNFYDAFNNGMCPFQSSAVGVSTFVTPGTLITPGSIVGTLSLVATPGLCGNYNLTDASGNTIVSGGGNFGASESNSFCIVNGAPQGNVPKTGSSIIFSERDMIYSNWKISPTLASNFIRVHFENSVAKQINLINVTGAVLQQFTIEENAGLQFTIDLNEVPVGINFIQIVTESGMVASKTFVKQ